ncbi:MAG: zinc-ribbon domain-containing protein [Candidatus Thorarchaeota archaeon]
MVRNLHLNFLLKKEGTRIKAESEGVSLAVALAIAEAQIGQRKRIINLSKVSLPFWIVQTSPTKSIVLSATSSTRKEFQFTEIRGAGEIKRIVGSDLSQPTDIPNVASKILPLLESVDSDTADVVNLVNPAVMETIGDFVWISDPSEEPNRVDTSLDSAGALRRTEEFRKISESAKLRIESAENLQKLVRETFGAQITILENLTNLEQERGNERVRMMDERTKQEIEKLTKDKDNKIYDLQEKHKMNLRAMTAEFSRAVNDLEQYFSGIIDEIRTARVQIGQKETDTEGAISIYGNLVNSLKTSIASSQQPLDMMDRKKVEFQERTSEAQAKFESDKLELENWLQTEIQDRMQRIDDSRNEMKGKSSELDDLKAQVRSATNKVQHSIENRVLTFQQEFLNLMNWTLDNNSVKDLAPLTLLDIYTFVAKYDDNSHCILTPCFIPQDGLLTTRGENKLSIEFDKEIQTAVDDWLKMDHSFKEAFERACTKGNVLVAAETEKLLVGGLEELLGRRIIQRDEIERLLTVWTRYSGKCPKCGAEVEAGAQFCQKCGAELGT